MADRIDNLVDQQRVDAEFARINKHIDALVKRIQALNTLAGQFNLGGRGGNGTGGGGNTGGGRGTSNQARTELEQLIEAQRRLHASTRAATQLIAQYNYQTNQQQRANRAAAQAANNHATSLNGMRARLIQLTMQYDAYDRAQRRSREEGRQTLKQIQQLQREILQLERLTGRSQRNVGNYPKQLVGGITGFLGAFGITTGVAATAKAVFDTTVQLDSLNAALKLVSKSDHEFAENQKYLLGLSERLGLNILDLTKAYKLFYAASTQAGLSAFTTRKIFTSVSEVAANLKLSQEDTNGVLLAFSQILGKGKVQAEELRGQIGERLPGAFSIAARSIGVTEQELNKMLEKGQVIASDFLPKFAAELEKTFGRNTEEKVEGLQASINRLSNEFTNVISNNQSGLNKFFTFVIDGFTGAIRLLDVFISKFTKLNPSDFSAEALSTAASQGRVYTGKIGPINLYDNIDPKEFKKRYDAAINAAKSTNDAYLKDFAQTEKKVQEVLINGVRQSFLEAKQIRDNLAKTSKFTPEFFEADMTFQREADRFIRAKRIMQDQAIVPQVVAAGPTKAEQDQAARLNELRIKANADARRSEMEEEIANQKGILENEKKSLSERLIANKEYILLKNELARSEAESEKARIQAEIKRGKAVPEQLAAIESKYNKEISDTTRENSQNITKIIIDNADERTKTIVRRYEQESEVIETNQNKELSLVQTFYKKGLITKTQYEDEKLRIDNKYAILQLQNELALQEEILQISKKYADPDKVKEIENKIKDIRNKIRELDLAFFEDSEKKKTDRAAKEQRKREELRRKEIEGIKQVARESVDALFSIFGAQFENQKNMIQDQMDQLDKKTQKEVEAVNASTDTEENKANKIANINARAAAQKEALERRQRQIDQEKARFERLKSIGEIVAGTAVNIVKVFPNPVLIALAAAVGAAQLAQVLATPIPKYKHGAGVNGRPAHKGGLAQVNDGGKLEVLESPSGQAYVAKGMNAVVDMPAGYKVHPSISEYYAASNASAFKPIPVVDTSVAGAAQVVGHITAQYKQQTAQLLAGMEKNKSIMIVKNSWSGLQASQKHASGLTNYLNRNVHN